jgi:hypothetical protein
MPCLYLADTKPEDRSALCRLLLDLKKEVVGEAVDWDLLLSTPDAAVGELRKACPAEFVMGLISHLDARQQVALPAGAGAFISKGERHERVAERQRLVVNSVRT